MWRLNLLVLHLQSAPSVTLCRNTSTGRWRVRRNITRLWNRNWHIATSKLRAGVCTILSERSLSWRRAISFVLSMTKWIQQRLPSLACESPPNSLHHLVTFQWTSPRWWRMGMEMVPMHTTRQTCGQETLITLFLPLQDCLGVSRNFPFVNPVDCFLTRLPILSLRPCSEEIPDV